MIIARNKLLGPVYCKIAGVLRGFFKQPDVVFLIENHAQTKMNI